MDNKENKENENYESVGNATIWKDRMHHLWFPISFTKYSIADGRLYIDTGFLSSREDECLLYRILDITMTRNLAQKIFGTGTIDLNTKDRSTPVIQLKNIKNPVEVKRFLSQLIEKERMEKNVVGRDMYGASSHMDPEEMHEMHELDLDDHDFH